MFSSITCPGQLASLACQLEVCAPKPGNVHRAADFHDMGLADFLISATVIAPVFSQAGRLSVGQLVRQSIEATRAATRANTNLGIVLLLAPLAKVPHGQSLRQGVGQVLRSLTPADARDVYAAIRTVSPGGLGSVNSHGHSVQPMADVQHDAPPNDLLEAMRSAAAWDLVAAQYANDFHHVLNIALPWLRDGADKWPLAERIVATHVRLMAAYPDSLIARKCGQEVADESAARATAVLRAGPLYGPAYHEALADLDFWLRSDHNRRNPGTTADLVSAAIFADLRDS